MMNKLMIVSYIFKKFFLIVYSKIKEIIDNLGKNNNENNNNNIQVFDSSNLDKKIKDLSDELEKIKKDLNNTKENVKDNKEKIDTIIPRLDDIIKGYKEGDDNLQKQIDDLKKYIDDKIGELQSQLDLFINKPLKGSAPGIGSGDLKAIQDLIKRLTQIEINFREFVEKCRIDDLWKEIDNLKNNKADISYVDDKINDILKQLKDSLNKINDLNNKYNEHQDEIDYIKKRLDELFTLIRELQNSISKLSSFKFEGKQPEIDLSQYVSMIIFNDYKKENDDKFNQIFSELERLKKLIEELLNLLKNKADLSDLEDLKNFLLQKIDELAIACNKKFADKNETAKNFRYLEQQIKKILSMLLNKKDEHGDNWLLAKKPLNGYSCAACESYIGELKDNTQYIPWNRYPLRDPNEKLYRIGNGFSKMLQMLNVDNVEPSNTPLEKNQTSKNFYKGNNKENNNVNGGKGRIQSAHYRNKMNNIGLNDNVNSVEDNSKVNNSGGNNLPKLKKKNEGFDSSINDVKDEDEEGPKIMKVYKKGKK